MREILHAWRVFFIDGGDFARLEGEREKECPGGRLPLNAGELKPDVPVRKIHHEVPE